MSRAYEEYLYGYHFGASLVYCFITLPNNPQHATKIELSSLNIYIWIITKICPKFEVSLSLQNSLVGIACRLIVETKIQQLPSSNIFLSTLSCQDLSTVWRERYDICRTDKQHTTGYKSIDTDTGIDITQTRDQRREILSSESFKIYHICLLYIHWRWSYSCLFTIWE